jgi:hypothetical protein
MRFPGSGAGSGSGSNREFESGIEIESEIEEPSSGRGVAGKVHSFPSILAKLATYCPVRHPEPPVARPVLTGIHFPARYVRVGCREEVVP